MITEPKDQRERRAHRGSRPLRFDSVGLPAARGHRALCRRLKEARRIETRYEKLAIALPAAKQRARDRLPG